MTKIKNVSTEELKSRLDKGMDFHFWNVLTDEHFNGELIPGSHRIPLDRIGREAAAMHITPSSEIVVYCAGPKCPMSQMAAEKLQRLGYTNVLTYEGGLEEWKKAGYEITKSEMEQA